jgi:hypothetical protein
MNIQNMPQSSAAPESTESGGPPPLPIADSQSSGMPPPLPKVERDENTDARLQLAFMALTARRYDEAERRFSEILAVSPSAMVWMGLGGAKVWAFMSGTASTDEIVFCFRQAVAIGTERERTLAQDGFLATVDDFLTLCSESLRSLWASENSAADSRRRGILAIGVSCLTNGSRNLSTAITSANLLNNGASHLATGRAVRQNVEESKRTLYSRLVAMRSAIQQVLPADHPKLLKAVAAVDQLILALYPQSQTSNPEPAKAVAGTRQITARTGPVETSGFAIASLVCGILSFVIIPLFVPAIILGHLARSRIKNAEGALGGGRLAGIGLAIGYAIFAFSVALFIFIAIAPR